MEVIVFSGRWSNNEDVAGGERRSVGGWLCCATPIKSGWLGVAFKRGMKSSMDEDIKHFIVSSCSLVKPPDPVVCSTLGSLATKEGSRISGNFGLSSSVWDRCCLLAEALGRYFKAVVSIASKALRELVVTRFNWPRRRHNTFVARCLKWVSAGVSRDVGVPMRLRVLGILRFF